MDMKSLWNMITVMEQTINQKSIILMFETDPCIHHIKVELKTNMSCASICLDVYRQ